MWPTHLSDWIELYNPGPKIASTSNLFLTDETENPTKWPVPEIIMEPNQAVVIFASGKDRQNANAELHTNFKIGAKGEYLTLIHSAGSTTEQVSFFGPRYPKQERGISFGLAPEGSTGTLSVPTPGGRNTEVVMWGIWARCNSVTRDPCANRLFGLF